MAKNVKINGVVYSNVPEVDIPLADGTGAAKFFDSSDATATAADIAAGKTAYGASGSIVGTMTAPVISQDTNTHILSIG